MGFYHQSPSWASLLTTLLLAATRCAALTQQYCSTENTGANSLHQYSIYMSNGKCQSICAGYAFAVVQWQDCWCSNYVPADQADVSSCSQKCPGYPQESCGDQDTGYFGYVALNVAPSGTAGGTSSPTTQTSTTSAAPQTSSTTSSSSLSSSTTSTTTEVITPSSASSPPPASTVTSIVTQAPTTSDSPTTTPSTTATPTLVTNTQVVTISGAIITQTVTSTPVPLPTAGSVQESPQTKKSNTGAVVGGVVGGLAGLVLIFGLLFFLWWRRRSSTDHPSSARKLDRNASILSKAGLLGVGVGGGRTADPEKSLDETDYGAQRHSTLYNAAEGSPISVPEGAYDRNGSLGRRNSRPLVYDQRLNPAALMENWQNNGSRSSVNTMQDQRDYSRPLGITNPDP